MPTAQEMLYRSIHYNIESARKSAKVETTIVNIVQKDTSTVQLTVIVSGTSSTTTEGFDAATATRTGNNRIDRF